MRSQHVPQSLFGVAESVFRIANAAGKVHHRSATGQLEYWADLGRKVESFLGPIDILKLMSGNAELVVRARESIAVRSEDVFADVEAMRAAGTLAAAVAPTARFRYQASEQYPGYLEQIDEVGEKLTGRFQDGAFVEGL